MSAARIAEVLAGHKVRSRNGNYLVRCPAHEDDHPSLSLADGKHGVLLYCFAGCDARDIFAAIRRKDKRLLDDRAPAPPPTEGTAEHERRQHEKAAWLWGRRHPIGGTIAETYLRTRGIVGPLPPTLANLPPSAKYPHPTVMAAFGLCAELEPGVLAPPRSVNAVHLTLLKPDGSGKANTDPVKLTIGKPLKRPIILAPPNNLLGLAICEGIEDALTAHAATGLGAWASASAGFMPGLADSVPSYINAATIFAHADKPGQDGACKLATALRARGIETTVEGLS
jgi:hypothetical protein